MNKATLIYPHQLFENNKLLNKNNLHVLIEDPLFLGDHNYHLKFHKQKLILHRASLKYYENFLKAKDLNTLYLEYKDLPKLDSVFKKLSKKGIQQIDVFDQVDYILEKRIKKYSKEYDLELTIHETPNFINSKDEIKEYFRGHKYHQTNFYINNRKNLNILLDSNKKPEGGKWTYDTENRKKLPRKITVPDISVFKETKYDKEAIQYVQKNFKNNPGSTKGQIYFPKTHQQARKLLEDFIETRLSDYGTYQDAISKEHNALLFHSAISSSINNGLLDPMFAIKMVIKAYEKDKKNYELNSVEGFVRQILGWREFMRAIYILEGTKQRNKNFFNHKNKLSDAFWNGTTGIKPVDDCIVKVNENCYLHHIERLMIMGNFMLLCKIKPDEVYKWFASLFIDAYDWVMVPNVYGMSQFADGGMMVTKPYISSSNYVLKMSDYKENNWSNIWDALYWNFIDENLDFIKNNPRLRMMTTHLKRMGEDKVKEHKKVANDFISRVTKE